MSPPKKDRNPIKGGCQKKQTVFFGRSLPNLFTHPRVFVRFGRTTGEIQVKKGDFQGDFFLWVWTLFGNQTHTFGRNLQKKRFFWTPSLMLAEESLLVTKESVRCNLCKHIGLIFTNLQPLGNFYTLPIFTFLLTEVRILLNNTELSF